jgi:hypothetical protein
LIKQPEVEKSHATVSLKKANLITERGEMAILLLRISSFCEAAEI